MDEYLPCLTIPASALVGLTGVLFAGLFSSAFGSGSTCISMSSPIVKVLGISENSRIYSLIGND